MAPELRNVAWHYDLRQVVRIDYTWISSEKSRKKPRGRGEKWNREGFCLLLEDLPGSFWFLALMRYLMSLCNPFIK